jgi:hypothetical protein
MSSSYSSAQAAPMTLVLDPELKFARGIKIIEQCIIMS